MLVFGWIMRGPDHEAVIRSCRQGSEAEASILINGIAAIAECGLPPPRIVSAPGDKRGRKLILSFEVFSGRRPQHHSSGPSPVVTRRHSAIRSCPQRHDHLGRLAGHATRGPSVRMRYQRTWGTVFLEHPGSATPTGSAHVVPAHCRPRHLG